MSNLKIALHQFNPIVGDVDGNLRAMTAAILAAKENNCDLFVTSELAISGYGSLDLFLRDDFYLAQTKALNDLLQITGITIICGAQYRHAAAEYQHVGYTQSQYKRRTKNFNSAFVFRDGVILGRYDKCLLPNYGVFDECRYFSPGNTPLVFECNGVKVGVIICEDVWDSAPAESSRNAGAEMICVLNASPYHVGKHVQRIIAARERVHETVVPLIYVNQVGGQDELIFDGASFALDNAGELYVQLPAFTPALSYIELNISHCKQSKTAWQSHVRDPMPLITPYPDKLNGIYSALVLALQDYVEKNSFSGVVLGLSGGIDSALTLAIAVDALGCDQVMAVMLPSQYTADISNIDAKKMIDTLGVKSTTIPIEPIFNQQA